MQLHWPNRSGLKKELYTRENRDHIRIVSHQDIEGFDEIVGTFDGAEDGLFEMDGTEDGSLLGAKDTEGADDGTILGGCSS